MAGSAPDATSWHRRFRHAGPPVAAALAAAAFATWLLLNHAGLTMRLTVSDLVFVLAPAVAAARCRRAARRRGPDAAAWGWIAAGCTTWSVGSAIWTVYELGLGMVSPFPSLADLCYVGYAVPMVVGLCRFSRVSADSVWTVPRIVTDTVAISAALIYS